MNKLTSVFLALCSLLPVYNAGPVVAVQPGQVVTLWSAETPTPGNGTTAASQQVALTLPVGQGGFAIDGKFSGAPGTFEVDVQVAAVDADTNYQTVSNGNVTSVDSTNNTFHFDGTLVKAKFVRLLMRTRTNSVSITATITG
jgi:hypothetical protein